MFLRICVFVFFFVGCSCTDGGPAHDPAAKHSDKQGASAHKILAELDGLVTQVCACADEACRAKVIDLLQEWSVRHGPSQDRFSAQQKEDARAKAEAFSECVAPRAMDSAR